MLVWSASGAAWADGGSEQLKWRAPKFSAGASETPGATLQSPASSATVGTTQVSFRVNDCSENVPASATAPVEKSVLRRVDVTPESTKSQGVRRAAATDFDLTGGTTHAAPQVRSRLSTTAQRKKVSDFPDLDLDEPALPAKPDLPKFDDEGDSNDFGPTPPRKTMPDEEPSVEVPIAPKETPTVPKNIMEPEFPNQPARENLDCDVYRTKCRQILDELRSKGIATIGLDYGTQYKFDKQGRPTANLAMEGVDYPCESTLGDEPYLARQWSEVCFEWKASCLCHKPIYFEEVQVERYGHSCNPVLQPVVHAVHFFGTLPILPYKMGLEPPRECVYALGYYRPGNCAPYVINPLPINGRAAAWEGAAWTAAALVIP